MIVGTVSDEGVPLITLKLADRDWQAIVDTGFNGFLELPAQLFSFLAPEYLGRTVSLLAAGQQAEQDEYVVYIPFDGELVRAEATFVADEQILVGTSLLRKHCLEIDFVEATVVLRRD